jgi:CubicO group peptidase (beta-lactamase class C family)
MAWTRRSSLPKYLPPEAFPLDDPRKAEISLGQLLSMAAGVRGTNPVYVKGVKQTWEHPTEDNGPYSTTDGFALEAVSLVRAWRLLFLFDRLQPHSRDHRAHEDGHGMEDYMRQRLTTPMGFGTWGYAMYRPKLKGGIDSNGRMFHTPGGGSIAVRSTDMLRFGYLMLHEGKWGKQQVVPADFAKMCGRMVKYNPHYNHSFNFNVNEQGAYPDVPRDAFWKGGSGGYAIYIVPSLDLVIYKMGGTEGQYNPELTRLPVSYTYDGSRANWKPGDPKAIGDSTGKTVQMVVAAISK